MTNLTYVQVRQLAVDAGFGANADVAAAIAMAESSGNPDAQGDVLIQTSKWGPSVGLWQIRSLKNQGFYTGADALRVASKLRDPADNAAAAKAIFDQRSSFGPWSTYDGGKGAFLKFLQRGGTGTASTGAVNALYTPGSNPAGVQTTGFLSDAADGVTGAVGDAAGGVAGALGDAAGGAVGVVIPDSIEGPLSKGLGLITSGGFWQRAGWFAGGYFLVIAGLLVILLSNKDAKNAITGTAKGVGGTAVSAAVGLVPGGGTVKAVAGGATKATKAAAKGAGGAAKAAGSGAAGAAKSVGSGAAGAVKTAGKTVAGK